MARHKTTNRRLDLIYDFVIDYSKKNFRTPIVKEIADYMKEKTGQGSQSGVKYLIYELIKDGRLHKREGKAFFTHLAPQEK